MNMHTEQEEQNRGLSPRAQADSRQDRAQGPGNDGKNDQENVQDSAQDSNGENAQESERINPQDSQTARNPQTPANLKNQAPASLFSASPAASFLSGSPGLPGSPGTVSAPDPDRTVANVTGALDTPGLRAAFVKQDSFLYLSEFLPADATQQLDAIARALLPQVNRNYLPGHKQGGSVSRHTLDQHAPFIAQLYRSPALIGWLEKITGDRLQLSPDSDPHAYALYYYTRAGDHIGWHYDTSYYDGRRYTMLLGIADDSSCWLDYELHTRSPGVPPESGSVQYPPGALVLFDGDRLRHRVTPAAAGDFRVSLTFEYVTDPHMRPWRHFVSNMKDAIAYFGFRQVFRKTLRPSLANPANSPTRGENA